MCAGVDPKEEFIVIGTYNYGMNVLYTAQYLVLYTCGNPSDVDPMILCHWFSGVVLKGRSLPTIFVPRLAANGVSYYYLSAPPRCTGTQLECNMCN